VTGWAFDRGGGAGDRVALDQGTHDLPSVIPIPVCVKHGVIIRWCDVSTQLY